MRLAEEHLQHDTKPTDRTIGRNNYDSISLNSDVVGHTEVVTVDIEPIPSGEQQWRSWQLPSTGSPERRRVQVALGGEEEDAIVPCGEGNDEGPVRPWRETPNQVVSMLDDDDDDRTSLGSTITSRDGMNQLGLGNGWNRQAVQVMENGVTEPYRMNGCVLPSYDTAKVPARQGDNVLEGCNDVHVTETQTNHIYKGSVVINQYWCPITPDQVSKWCSSRRCVIGTCSLALAATVVITLAVLLSHPPAPNDGSSITSTAQITPGTTPSTLPIIPTTSTTLPTIPTTLPTVPTTPTTLPTIPTTPTTEPTTPTSVVTPNDTTTVTFSPPPPSSLSPPASSSTPSSMPWCDNPPKPPMSSCPASSKPASVVNAATREGDELRITTREEWGACDPKEPPEIQITRYFFVLIRETGTQMCTTKSDCIENARAVQARDFGKKGVADIECHYLIGGDGTIFEGRSIVSVVQIEDVSDYHAYMVISFFGTFDCDTPTPAQLDAAGRLIQRVIDLEKLYSKYSLKALKNITPQDNPGKNLYESMKTWPRWCGGKDC